MAELIATEGLTPQLTERVEHAGARLYVAMESSINPPHRRYRLITVRAAVPGRRASTVIDGDQHLGRAVREALRTCVIASPVDQNG